MSPPFYFFMKCKLPRVKVRLNVNYKSNKWTLTALCTYCNCMWSILKHMKHTMFSLRLLIAHLCNWVIFVYTELNLRYYLSTIYIPVAFILIMYNENKTSISLETLERFDNGVFLKSLLLTNLCYSIFPFIQQLVT